MNSDEAWEQFKKAVNSERSVQKAKGTSMVDRMNILSSQEANIEQRIDELEEKIDQLMNPPQDPMAAGGMPPQGMPMDMMAPQGMPPQGMPPGGAPPMDPSMMAGGVPPGAGMGAGAGGPFAQSAKGKKILRSKSKISKADEGDAVKDETVKEEVVKEEAEPKKNSDGGNTSDAGIEAGEFTGRDKYVLYRMGLWHPISGIKADRTMITVRDKEGYKTPKRIDFANFKPKEARNFATVSIGMTDDDWTKATKKYGRFGKKKIIKPEHIELFKQKFSPTWADEEGIFDPISYDEYSKAIDLYNNKISRSNRTSARSTVNAQSFLHNVLTADVLGINMEDQVAQLRDDIASGKKAHDVLKRMYDTYLKGDGDEEFQYAVRTPYTSGKTYGTQYKTDAEIQDIIDKMRSKYEEIKESNPQAAEVMLSDIELVEDNLAKGNILNNDDYVGMANVLKDVLHKATSSNGKPASSTGMDWDTFQTYKVLGAFKRNPKLNSAIYRALKSNKGRITRAEFNNIINNYLAENPEIHGIIEGLDKDGDTPLLEYLRDKDTSEWTVADKIAHAANLLAHGLSLKDQYGKTFDASAKKIPGLEYILDDEYVDNLTPDKIARGKISTTFDAGNEDVTPEMVTKFANDLESSVYNNRVLGVVKSPKLKKYLSDIDMWAKRISMSYNDAKTPTGTGGGKAGIYAGAVKKLNDMVNHPENYITDDKQVCDIVSKIVKSMLTMEHAGMVGSADTGISQKTLGLALSFLDIFDKGENLGPKGTFRKILNSELVGPNIDKPIHPPIPEEQGDPDGSKTEQKTREYVENVLGYPMNGDMDDSQVHEYLSVLKALSRTFKNSRAANLVPNYMRLEDMVEIANESNTRPGYSAMHVYTGEGGLKNLLTEGRKRKGNMDYLDERRIIAENIAAEAGRNGGVWPKSAALLSLEDMENLDIYNSDYPNIADISMLPPHLRSVVRKQLRKRGIEIDDLPQTRGDAMFSQDQDTNPRGLYKPTYSGYNLIESHPLETSSLLKDIYDSVDRQMGHNVYPGTLDDFTRGNMSYEKFESDKKSRRETQEALLRELAESDDPEDIKFLASLMKDFPSLTTVDKDTEINAVLDQFGDEDTLTLPKRGTLPSGEEYIYMEELSNPTEFIDKIEAIKKEISDYDTLERMKLARPEELEKRDELKIQLKQLMDEFEQYKVDMRANDVLGEKIRNASKGSLINEIKRGGLDNWLSKGGAELEKRLIDHFGIDSSKGPRSSVAMVDRLIQIPEFAKRTGLSTVNWRALSPEEREVYAGLILNNLTSNILPEVKRAPGKQKLNATKIGRLSRMYGATPLTDAFGPHARDNSTVASFLTPGAVKRGKDDRAELTYKVAATPGDQLTRYPAVAGDEIDANRGSLHELACDLAFRIGLENSKDKDSNGVFLDDAYLYYTMKNNLFKFGLMSEKNPGMTVFEAGDPITFKVMAGLRRMKTTLDHMAEETLSDRYDNGGFGREYSAELRKLMNEGMPQDVRMDLRKMRENSIEIHRLHDESKKLAVTYPRDREEELELKRRLSNIAFKVAGYVKWNKENGERLKAWWDAERRMKRFMQSVDPAIGGKYEVSNSPDTDLSAPLSFLGHRPAGLTSSPPPAPEYKPATYIPLPRTTYSDSSPQAAADYVYRSIQDKHAEEMEGLYSEVSGTSFRSDMTDVVAKLLRMYTPARVREALGDFFDENMNNGTQVGINAFSKQELYDRMLKLTSARTQLALATWEKLARSKQITKYLNDLDNKVA